MPLHAATIVTPTWTEVPNQNFSAIDLPGLLYRLVPQERLKVHSAQEESSSSESFFVR